MAKETAKTKKYIVLAPPQAPEIDTSAYGSTPGVTGWSHGGKLYAPGEVLDLTDDGAKDLLDCGVIEAASGNAPEAPAETPPSVDSILTPTP